MTANEINALLIEKAKEQRERCSAAKEIYSKEYGIPDSSTDDIMSFVCFENASLEVNLRNALAVANNNMITGLYNEYRSLGLDKKLKEEKKLKQAAFLFILRHGMMNEFQSFVNNYQGDVKEDIYHERMRQS